MIYLKLFRKHFFLLLLIMLTACVSSNDSLTENTIPDTTPIEVIKVEEPILTEISTEIDALNWTSPGMSELSYVIYLPEIPLKTIENVLNDNESSMNEEKEKIVVYDGDDLDFSFFIPNSPVIENKKILPDTEKVLSEIIQLTPSDLNNDLQKNDIQVKQIFTERDLSAPIYDKLDISLIGSSWIYLPDEENNNIEYQGRKFIESDTIYTFIPQNEGLFTLRFQFQDLSSNTYTIEKVNLRVVLNNHVDTSADNYDSTEIITDNNLDQDLIKVQDFESQINEMLNKGDSEGLSQIYSKLLASSISGVRERLPEIADILYSSSFYIPSASILEKLISDDSLFSSKDYFLYLLGKIYEEESPIRNEKISASYYKMLIDSFPASIYWNESQDRYRFLKRRYIDIR
jgi:hypothetical protein